MKTNIEYFKPFKLESFFPSRFQNVYLKFHEYILNLDSKKQFHYEDFDNFYSDFISFLTSYKINLEILNSFKVIERYGNESVYNVIFKFDQECYSTFLNYRKTYRLNYSYNEQRAKEKGIEKGIEFLNCILKKEAFPFKKRGERKKIQVEKCNLK